jgi:glycosyltransferase involved in cell wall biosynthesis
MRIHHVTPHFSPDRGGIEAHVLGLSEFLVKRGHEVVVHTSALSYGGGRLPDPDRIGGVVVRRYRPLIRLGYYTTTFHPDFAGAELVHLHGYGLLANDWSARRANRLGVPVVYSLHHGVARPEPTARARVERAVYDRILGLRSLSLASAIIAANEADRQWLETRGIQSSRIHVIPTGLEEIAFEAGVPARVRETLGLGRYVLYVGRLQREKSVDTLLRAFASLSPERTSLVLAGPDAGEGARLRALASALGIQDRVRFLGEVDEATKRDLLAGCEVLVLPSFYEAQGIAVLEAWAQARPVIASRVGGVLELVEDGHDGLLVPWGDVQALAERLRRILGDRNLGTALGDAGFTKARERYAWTRLAPEVEAVYESLLRLAPS